MPEQVFGEEKDSSARLENLTLRFIVLNFVSLSEIRLEEVHSGILSEKSGKVVPRRRTDVGKGAGTDSE